MVNIQNYLNNVNISLTSAEYRMLSLDKGSQVLLFGTYITSFISFKFIEFPFLKWTTIYNRLTYKALGEPFRCNLLSLVMFPCFYTVSQLYQLFLYRNADSSSIRLTILCLIAPDIFVASQVGSYIKRSNPSVSLLRVHFLGVLFNGTLNALNVSLFYHFERLKMSFFHYCILAVSLKYFSLNTNCWLMFVKFDSYLKLNQVDLDLLKQNITRLKIWYNFNNIVSMGIIGGFYFNKELH